MRWNVVGEGGEMRFSIEPDEGARPHRTIAHLPPCQSGESRNPASCLGLSSWTPTFVGVTKKIGGRETFLLTTFLIESSHSSPCSVKEALSGCRFLSVEKGRCL